MTFIEFNDNVPNGPDFPSDDQTDMLLNTQSTNTIFDVDHFTFEDVNLYGGYHRYASLPATINPVVPYSMTSGVLFGFEIENDTWPSYSNSSTNNKFIIGGRPNTKNLDSGYTYLFGGLIMQWGFAKYSLTTKYEFPLKFSEIPFNIKVQIYNPTSTISSSSRFLYTVRDISKSQFSIAVSISGISTTSALVYWTAIGLQ